MSGSIENCAQRELLKKTPGLQQLLALSWWPGIFMHVSKRYRNAKSNGRRPGVAVQQKLTINYGVSGGHKITNQCIVIGGLSAH
jgi:hypothetical protein